MENPIYKFMKDNGLTQKDEATFVSEYSNPQKSAELHKFMTDNGLTTKGADEFYNEYFSASKKKGGTTPDSGQPGKPSTPSFGQKVVTEALVSGEPVMKGVQKKPVEKKPYQDITYKREELPSETTQMPETPVVRAAKKDFKQTQLKPQVQLKSTPEELEEIQKKTEKADKIGLALNDYQSTSDSVNELEKLKKSNVNEFYRNIKDARPDLYEKYSGRTIQEGRNIESDINESQKDRDTVYSNYLSDLLRADEAHKTSISKATPIIDAVVDEKVNPDTYKKLTTQHSIEFGGDVVDMGKVDDEAVAIAEKYNLPTDGEAWRLLKNKIKANTDFQIIKPQAEEIFKSKYPDLQAKRQKMFDDGFKYDDEIYSRVEAELVALQDQYAADAKNEFNAIDSEYKSKAGLLNQQYKDFTTKAEQAEKQLTQLYQTGQIDQLTYEAQWGDLQKEKKDYYDLYQRDFPTPDEYVKKSNEINSKYNRKFELQKKALTDKAQAQIKAEFDKYSASYKEDPAVLEELNKAYKESYELASDIRTKKMGLGAEMSNVPMVKLYQSTLSSLGGVFKGWGGSFDSKTLELLGESMEQNFMMPAARTEEFKDWADPQNLQLLTGQLLGSMAPSMAITAAVATATGGSGIPAIVPMITGGLAGWGAETVDIVGRSYLDMFEKSGGDVTRSNKAAERSLKSQYDIMFTYAFDALPFVGKALKGIPTRAGRVAVGAGIETGTEFLQEYPQNIAEENIQKGLDPWTNLGEALQDTKKMKQTLISIGPVAILGGAGQLGSKSAKQEAIDTYVAMQQKEALASALPDQKRQYIQNMVFDRGGKFSKGVVGALFADGTIDEETSKELLVQVERSEKIQEAGKEAGLKGSKLNIYGFYSARADEAERNAAKFGNDPILSESYKQQAKQYRDAGLDFMKGNNPDLLTVTYADGSQAIMTPEDVNGLFSNPIALTLLNKNKISVEAYRENGESGKALGELSERAKSYKENKRYVAPAKRGTSLEYWQGLAERRIQQLNTQQPELSEEERLAAIKKIEDEVNASFEAQIEQEKQQKRDQRDIEIEQIQQQREALGVSEVDAFFSDMKPLVATVVERMETGQNAPQSGVKAASDYLYAKYKELTAMKSDPNRMMTIAQIESIQAQIEQDLQTLAGNPPSQKTETNDQENIQGIPSQVREGQEPVATQPIEGTSEEAAPTGGVLQAQEEVTPQVTTEPIVKPSRRQRLAKMFETPEGEVAAEKVANFLEEANIGVEVLDPKSFEETGKQRNFEGDADGIFLVDNNTGKIYLNKEKIKGAEGKTIAFHEGIHPVVNIIRNTNPKLYSAIVDGLKAEAAKNAGVAQAAAAVAASEYYQEQGPSAIEDETVVETMARVAAGDIDIDTFEPSFREKFIEFMNKLAKMLGLKPIAVNSPRMEVKRLADQLSKALNEGGKLSDVVGKENVGEFQNKVGAQKRAVSIAKGKESLAKYGLKKGINTTRKIGEALEKRSRELYGIIAREDRSEKALKAISSFMADEVRFFVDAFGENSGKGWYGEKFQKGLDAMAAVFPEMKDDQNARDLFTMLVAITSDGTEVMQNFQQASLAYKNYKETGKMPTTAKAQRAESYMVNFRNIQDLLDKYNGDVQAIKKELLTIESISELNQQRKTQGLEKLDTKWPASFKVPLAASIFGPKLGMFYANLSGMEQYPTLDRWWSRTFNRYRGTLIPQITRGYNKKGEALGIDRYREIAGLKDASEEEVLAKIVQDHDTYEDKGYKKGTPAEKAANTLYKKLYVELNDAPFGAKDRQFMYDAFIETQKKLKRSGVDVTIADIQAILWYFEKNLYKKLGVTKPIQGISYEDAANKTYEKWKNSGNSFDYTIKDSEQGETIDEVDIDEEAAPTVQPSKGIKRGKYEPLPGAPTPQGATGPIKELVDVAESYAKKFGVPYTRQGEYVQVDEAFAKRIADAYENMKHDPKDPKVKEAYDDLVRQTTDQYNALMDAGYEFTFFDSETDPYKGNPMDAMRDLRANKKMAVYGTYDGYGTEGITGAKIEDNPMLAPTGLQWPDQSGKMHDVTANDLFRAVHDAFGHGLEGAGFRARGEENAWQAHARLFTGPAVAAITSETRGQNSWLNYGPFGEKNRKAKLEDTVFAEQKTGLMPEWTWTENVAPAMPSDEGRTEPVMIENAPEGTYLNIGLKEGMTNKMIPIKTVLSKLPKDVQVIKSTSTQGTEPTAAIEISRKLTDEEMDKLLEDTKQLAIPQLSDGEGVIHGTKDWGDFNADFFVLPNGKKLSDVGAKKAQPSIEGASQEQIKGTEVSDKNGNPIKVYHGTNVDFESFKKTKSTRTVLMTPHDVETSAFFFHPDRAFAESFGPKVKEVYLNIQKLANNHPEDLKSAIKETWGSKGSVETANNGVVYFDDYTGDGWMKKIADKDGIDWMLLEDEAFIKNLEKKGIGGTGVWEDDGSVSFAVFDADNIVQPKGQPSMVKRNVINETAKALKDVESTAKALEGVDKEKGKNVLSGLMNEFTGKDYFYHGTTKDFSKFKQVKKMGVEAIETEQPVFLAQDKNAAEPFSVAKGGRLLRVKVAKDARIFDPTKIVTNDSPIEYDYSNLTPEAKKLAEAFDNGEIELTLGKLRDKDGYEILSQYIKHGDWDVLESKGVKEWLIKNGYDGTFIREFRNTPDKNLAIFNTDKLIINTPKSISEAYHADKAAGKETELTKAVEEVLGKPKVQPSMVKRTSAEVQRLMEDSMDSVDEAIADGVDAKTAVADNITSQDWYGDLTPKQKEQFDEIIKDEFGVTPEAPVAKPTGIKATIANIIDNYYKGDRQSKLDNKQILESDPKLKYIYDNISRINKQLQDAGVITDKTDGCP